VPGLAIVRPRSESAVAPRFGNGPDVFAPGFGPRIASRTRRAMTGSPQVRGEGRAHRVACRGLGMNAPGADVPGGSDRPCVIQSYVPVGAPPSPSADSIELQDAAAWLRILRAVGEGGLQYAEGRNIGGRRRGRPARGDEQQPARNGSTGRRAPQAGRGSVGAGRNCARDRGIRCQQAEYRACV
jgi:hypothetical protein